MTVTQQRKAPTTAADLVSGRRTPTAVVLANGVFRSNAGKTAHGVVRSTTRFRVLGVVDPTCAGRDAGEMVDGANRNIPIYESVTAMIRHSGVRPECCVIGAANKGGRVPPALRDDLVAAARLGLCLVSGLHQPLATDPEIAQAAAAGGAELLDIRKPRLPLRFWTGEVLTLPAPRLPLLGTDMNIGKRTTCLKLTKKFQETGVKAEMVYTGQTGWLQGIRHGILFDATPNDFVTGALERAVLECHADTGAELILIEGQSALRNPAGPCGAELITAMGAKGVVLLHAPGRKYYRDLQHLGCEVKPVEDEVKLIGLYGADVWAVVLNPEGLTPAEAEMHQQRLRQRLGVPVTFADAAGLAAVVDAVRSKLSP